MHPYNDRPDRSRKPAWLPAALLAAVLAAGSFVPDARAQIEYEEAHVFFELNHTDGDLGIHAKIDGEGWSDLQIRDSDGVLILDVTGHGELGDAQGVTEIFFESAEPTFDDLDPADFFDRFPEGTYEISGTLVEEVDGEDMIEGEAEVTHKMPAPPEPTVNGLPMAVQCDDEEPGFDATEVTAPVTIAWPQVKKSHPDSMGGGAGVQPPKNVKIHNYEVVVEVELDLPGGKEFETVFSVILPPGERQMTIPAEFIAQSDTFKYEVLAREESFNQTAVESCFVVE